MSMSKKELARIMFRAKMEKFCKNKNISLSEFFAATGFPPMKYHRLSKGNDSYFSSIIQLVKITDGYFTYEEMAELMGDEDA